MTGWFFMRGGERGPRFHSGSTCHPESTYHSGSTYHLHPGSTYYPGHHRKKPTLHVPYRNLGFNVDLQTPLPVVREHWEQAQGLLHL